MEIHSSSPPFSIFFLLIHAKDKSSPVVNANHDATSVDGSLDVLENINNTAAANRTFKTITSTTMNFEYLPFIS